MLIIGGGIIGIACADELARRGVSVMVIDQRDIGHGCSYGNAGWITPCFALPLAMPGTVWQGLKWMLNPESPFYIKPRPSLSLLRWLGSFMRAANEPQARRSAQALVELSRYSLEAYREMDAQADGAFGFTSRGLLMIAQTQAARQAAVREMEWMAALGVPGRELDNQALRELEPAVAQEADVAGSVYFPDEAHLEPLKAVQWLADRAQSRGAVLMPRTEVFEFRREGQRITGVRTTRGWLQADQVVLAAGSWTARLGRMLGLRVPILAGKGYSIVVEPIDAMPRIPWMLIDHKVAITPHRQALRIAGTLELVDLDESITTRRVEAILHNARRFLNLPDSPKIIEVWRGLRPCTPDGVPIIGRSSRLDNLLIAAGHQMLGMQTGPGTGRLVVDLITRQEPAFNPHPFRPARFAC